MYSSLVCIKAPMGLALSLEEAKGYLRITNSDDDELITRFIKSVTKVCESYTGLALINQGWQMRCDDFFMRRLELPKRPVYRINFIEQVDAYGNSKMLKYDQYAFSPEMSSLEFDSPLSPSHLKINFSSGFGENATDIPDDIKLTMNSHIAFLLESRGTGKEFPMRLYDNFKLYNI